MGLECQKIFKSSLKLLQYSSIPCDFKLPWSICWFTHKDAGLWDSFRQSHSSLSSREYSLRLPTLSHTNTPLVYVARNSFRHYILHFLLLRLKYIGYFVFKLEDINPHPFSTEYQVPHVHKFVKWSRLTKDLKA